MNLRLSVAALTLAALGAASTAPAFLLLQPASAFGSGRTVGGPGTTDFRVYQPFDVVGTPWIVTSIGVDGWEISDPGNVGFTGSLYMDDGSGLQPNESITLSSAVYNLGTNANISNWADMPQAAVLVAGRYWVKWQANDANHWSAVYNSSVGLPSFSRDGVGGQFASGSTALRIDGRLVPEPASVAALCVGVGVLLRRRRK